MAWNDGYFDKYDKQISADEVDKVVYDGYGKKVGYFSDNVIRSNNGDILTCSHDDSKCTAPKVDVFYTCFDYFLKTLILI
jgi:hypothetical protein